MSNMPDIRQQAIALLQKNDKGFYTIPAARLYPHQWLWDSCFVAIGQRHYDIERAKMEILSLLRGQWSNGMVPHMIFNSAAQYKRDRDTWRSWISPFAPDNVTTSGITQPPLLAEAVWRIGQKLELPERRSWYRQVLPPLISYHQWLYRERDPHQEGLLLQIHPWETGLDNTPPWMSELHEHLLPWWIRLLQRTKLDFLAVLVRRDTHLVPIRERFSNVDAMALFAAHRRLRRKEYNIDDILDHSLFTIEDLSFNAIFIRANELLSSIAKTLRTELPTELQEAFIRTRKALDKLWDPYTEAYYPRDFMTHKLIKEPSIESLLPLYAGSISAERAALLVKSLENAKMFGPAYPVPSVPLNSSWFDPIRYWQGPTWFNMNWLIVEGLKRYGYKEHAAALIESSLELVKNGQFNEYYNPITGDPLGADNFSWTAAVTLDWLETS